MDDKQNTDLSTFSPGQRDAQSSAEIGPEIPQSSNILVVGAGVFGGWTALHLLRSGYKVTLADGRGAGNSLSSSGGESRLIRAIYGHNRKYFDMTVNSWDAWKHLEKSTGKQVLHETGVIWLFHENGGDVRDAITTIMDGRDWPYEIYDPMEVNKRYPAINSSDLESVLNENKAGYLSARDACRLVCKQFVKEGGHFEQRDVLPDQKIIEQGYDVIIFACGPWLPQLFPELLVSKLQVTRQEVYFFDIPGKKSSNFSNLPPWIDWEPGTFFYGVPNKDLRGFKVACDIRGEECNPTSMERIPTPDLVERSRKFLAHRFPDISNSPVVESRICQYTNTADGNFLLDKHPELENLWFVGGGSGHGYKHGPELGRLAAEIVTGKRPLDPDFMLLD